MDNNFHIFPSETFIDLCLYQYGHEKCTPGHLFGPATRNHYLFHYVLSGTGTLMATNSKGQNVNYQVRSGQGFMIFPGQITTYVADIQVPWEYVWVEFDGLRTTEILNVCGFSKDAPVYMAHSREARKKMVDELIYISQNSEQSPFHLMGHFYLFADLLAQSVARPQPAATSKMSDYYIKGAIILSNRTSRMIFLLRMWQLYAVLTEAIWDEFSAPAQDTLHRNFSFITA